MQLKDIKIHRFFFILLVGSVLISVGLILLDVFRGDANGIVGGYDVVSACFKFQVFALLVYAFVLGFKSKLKFIQNLSVSVFMVFITIFLLELIAGFVLKRMAANSPKIEGPTHSMVMDDVLGYKPTPNESHTGVRTKDGQIIYKITYQTDANSLRITPVDSSKIRNRYAQFFGCSMTFGEGVQSNETLPYYFAKFDSTYKPYNFAYSGYGPHQMLARLQSNSVPGIVKEKGGIGFYIYIGDHVNRVIGTLTNYSYNGGNAPYYHKVGNELKHDGTFLSGRRLRSTIFNIMLKSNILKLFKIGYPFRIGEQDYALTADVMAESAREYKKQFGNDNFYVIIYPTTNDSSLIIRLLKERGVKVIDYSKLFNPLDSKYAIPYDEHPTALANQILIKQLLKDIVKPGFMSK